MNDIVYILKNDIKPDELRYSLRSLKNFPHGKVWFAGGVPDGLKPDGQIELHQTGATKYLRARSTFQAICNNDNITPDFYLFNDDFYVLQPISDYETPYDETLFEKIVRVENKYGHQTSYTSRLRNGAKWLRENGYDVKNYELHLPMIFNREKLGAILTDTSLPIRSLYGNIYQVDGVNRKDVKIISNIIIPGDDADFCSTSDKSWVYGNVGKYIRGIFTDKCEYEL